MLYIILYVYMDNTNNNEQFGDNEQSGDADTFVANNADTSVVNDADTRVVNDADTRVVKKYDYDYFAEFLYHLNTLTNTQPVAKTIKQVEKNKQNLMTLVCTTKLIKLKDIIDKELNRRHSLVDNTSLWDKLPLTIQLDILHKKENLEQKAQVFMINNGYTLKRLKTEYYRLRKKHRIMTEQYKLATNLNVIIKLHTAITNSKNEIQILLLEYLPLVIEHNQHFPEKPIKVLNFE